MSNILLIDDDRKLGEVLSEYFAQHQLQLTHCLHPKKGIDAFENQDFDLIILDVMMPDMDGFEVCRRIRQKSMVPIFMLTARGEVMDRVVGLELGADDYLPKPFEPRELIIRIQNALKRSTLASDQNTQTLRFKRLQIHTHLRQVELDDQMLNLTTAEYQLLTLLAKSPQKNFTRDEILNSLKGIEVELFSRSVDIAVSRLRKKIAPLDYIKTVWGAGYSFVPEIEG